MGFTSPKFSWLYQKSNGSQIRERLDKVVATIDWIIKFAQAKLFHKSSSTADHNPLVLKLVKEKTIPKHPKIFRFEAMWLKYSTCEEVVTSAWEEGLSMGPEFLILHCMDSCCTQLELWNKNVFGHVGKNITKLKKQLEWLELQLATTENIMAMRDTRVELNCWLDKEDSIWHQRSRLNWFQVRDRNTGYFHSKASTRFQKNIIKGLLDHNEILVRRCKCCGRHHS